MQSGKNIFFLLWILLIVASPQISAEVPTHYFVDSCSMLTQPVDYDAECGFLVVPENRNVPDSKQIEIAFAIIRSKHPSPAQDPVVYLAGGPGSSSLWRTADYFKRWFGDMVNNRDIIIVDQRGTGESQPRLQCIEFSGPRPSFATAIESREFIMQLLHKCHDRLEDDGIQLASYNSAENAADLNDLRIALGYEEWNLYGVSYGARLALTIMRDYPDGLRSVILDSALPPQSNLYTELIPNNTAAFDLVFQACAKDTLCNVWYPNLDEVFANLYAQFNEDPVEIPVRSGMLIIDGYRLYNWLYNWLYYTNDIVHIPRTLYALQNPDNQTTFQEALLLGLETEQQQSRVDIAMHYSVQCHEEVSFAKPSEFVEVLEQFPYLETYIINKLSVGDSLFDLCAGWHLPLPNSIENEPVFSDIPTLVVSGEFDPITPPTWGALVAQTLSNSYFYEIPSVGHGTIRTDPCAMNMAIQFVNSPNAQPDSSCLEVITTLEFVIR